MINVRKQLEEEQSDDLKSKFETKLKRAQENRLTILEAIQKRLKDHVSNPTHCLVTVHLKLT